MCTVQIFTLFLLDDIPSTDPATWSHHLSSKERDVLVLAGPPKNPPSFPRDSSMRAFPVNIFLKTLPNGEKVLRDWSQSNQGLFCFSCCLFREEQQSESSMLAKSNAGITDNWRKLYDRVQSHERNSSHLLYYCNWKHLEANLKKHTGIDASLQKELELHSKKSLKLRLLNGVKSYGVYCMLHCF